MILNRIQPAIDEHLRPNQNGFRLNRSTSSHILALCRIIKGVKQNKLPAVITFVDFRKAFDSVRRAKMMKILSAYGIPDELVKAISLLYENSRVKILSPDGDTQFFHTLAGAVPPARCSWSLLICNCHRLHHETSSRRSGIRPRIQAG